MPIDSIKEIRTGKNTPIFRNKEFSGAYCEECAFSIIYGEEFESLDLVATCPDEANIWITGLNALIGEQMDSAAGLWSGLWSGVRCRESVVTGQRVLGVEDSVVWTLGPVLVSNDVIEGQIGLNVNHYWTPTILSIIVHERVRNKRLSSTAFASEIIV